MQRLFLKIYLTIIASLLAVVLVAGAVWRFGSEQSFGAPAFEIAGEMAAAILPPATAPAAEQAEALQRLSRRLKIDLGLFDAERRLIAGAGREVPHPMMQRQSGWIRGAGGPAWTFRLPDDRYLVARPPPRYTHPAIGLVLLLGGIALAVAISAYPAARGLTRRLERLQEGVETLGAGKLTARVKVEGRDEVARLATSFNNAASRIEELVAAHRMLLANASHELRTPLSRIRLGVELMKEKAEPARRAELEADIAELDRLIEEILLASRLEAGQGMEAREEVDLLGLVAEECARYSEATLDGVPVKINGDPRLLRRLIRNLLENSRRHGLPPIDVTLALDGVHAVLTVADAGPGIPTAERERVFEPFRRLPGAAESTGAGLGLALVRQIARRHGGDAIVADGKNGRSGFRVSIAV